MALEMPPEVLGKIEVWVMRDGKIPTTVEGIDEFQTINVLTSLISRINKDMANKKQDYWEHWMQQPLRQKLYDFLLVTFGGDEGWPIINILAWTLNRVSARMARDKHVLVPDRNAPEIKIVH